MGYKNNDRCLDKVAEDEPIFVLRAQDILAPFIVYKWVEEVRYYYRVHEIPISSSLEKKLDEAEMCAQLMTNWPTRKIPD